METLDPQSIQRYPTYWVTEKRYQKYGVLIDVIIAGFEDTECVLFSRTINKLINLKLQISESKEKLRNDFNDDLTSLEIAQLEYGLRLNAFLLELKQILSDGHLSCPNSRKNIIYYVLDIFEHGTTN